MPFNPEMCRNESEVESKLIVQYLLPQLGYTPDTWHQEVAIGSIRLDFLAFAAQVIPFVLDANSPLSVVMEAKHPKQNLNHHVPRLRHYLTSLNVRYGLLTNGKEIRIYQKFQYDIQLVFQCSGKEVEIKLDEIKTLIGRESLKEGQLVDKSEVQIPGNNLNFEIKRQHLMKTIAIYHNKGGVGKTTVAVNLAAALRKKGKNVLLVDIDSQANTTFATGLIKFQFEEDDNLRELNVYHLLESGDFNFIPEVVRTSDYFNNPEIDVIPSHITLIEYQDKLNKILASRSRLVTKLKRVENNYDIVIIDTPPSRDLYAEVALIASDYLIIPSDLKPFANQGLPTVKNFVNQINESREMMGKPPISIMGVLASKISTNAKFLQYNFPKQREVISERYQLPLMEAVIYDRTALSECMNQTIPVGDLEYPDPKSIIKFAELKTSAQISAEEFNVLADEVIKKMGVY
ncbi:chromosome partitioning protein ParA [Nostoc sp. 'Peltigera membranacea cyanobiont' 210A]|uniref:AAA family ATPase n=1 Tax=Nostoc sp. 'Peltigera membranacea cyanobiont' 210A TaxID=2014529 RepID=UPI000B9508E0|nr:AAA family ATPase [Nostoc sp. 'Peltigera membranacea cyanobiont' 210A]OYD97910.1 chromosome partitioning protein ParA [Nostoc sp. 'Peltigera membranacea cyanobiont' 210A]